MLDLLDADLYVKFEENKDTENKVYRIVNSNTANFMECMHKFSLYISQSDLIVIHKL